MSPSTRDHSSFEVAEPAAPASEHERARWERLCHEAEEQRDSWERLCHEAEDQRSHWQRHCRESEQQRDEWQRLCRESEQQRDEWQRRCRESEQQRDEWQQLCREAERQRDLLLARDGSSPLEFSLPFSGIDACRDDLAALAVRERLLLYALVFALAPDRVLEIGTFKGGSARIVSAALNDLGRGGRLVTIDPFPELIEIDWSSVAHNAQSVKGYFPRDFQRSSALRDLRFDLVFVDGDHSHEGLLADLRYLPRILRRDSYVLLHDASHPEVGRAIDESIAECGYRDCGKVARITNISEGEPYGGMRLLWLP